MHNDQKQLRKLENMRRRGWIIYLLFASRPKPLAFAALIELLDARNIPMSHRRFSEEMDYLRSLGLLRVFPLGHEEEYTNVQQTKLIQRYCDSDGELADSCCACLTVKGVQFQEGDFEELGLTRVN